MSFNVDLDNTALKGDIKDGYHNVTVVSAESKTTAKGGKMAAIKFEVEGTGDYIYESYNYKNDSPRAEKIAVDALTQLAKVVGLTGVFTEERFIELCGAKLTVFVKNKVEDFSGRNKPKITSFKKL